MQNQLLEYWNHIGITGLIAEKAFIIKEGKRVEFDGMWSSSLTDSTSKGKPILKLLILQPECMA